MASQQFENLVAMFRAQREAGAGTEVALAEQRQGFDMLGQMLPPVEGVTTTEIDIAGLPSVRIEPDGAPDDRVILYLHGGGYCLGSRGSHGPIVASLAKASGLLTLLPEYRLAPEHPYPAAVEDARAAYSWVLEQGFDPSRIALAGESAGGGLIGALLIALRDAGEPLPSSATLISPWCDLSALGEVSDEALDTDFLRPEQIEAFTARYAPDPAHRTEALCSPVVGDLSGLPPLLIQVGGREILCDQGRRLASRAKDAGVDVTLDLDPEMFHAWPLFAGALPEADEAVARIASFVRANLR